MDIQTPMIIASLSQRRPTDLIVEDTVRSIAAITGNKPQG